VPPAECSPNSRSFWAKRYRAARAYQEAVYYECVNARNQLEAPWAAPGSVFLRARLIDKVRHLDDRQLRMMAHFADFLTGR